MNTEEICEQLMEELDDIKKMYALEFVVLITGFSTETPLVNTGVFGQGINPNMLPSLLLKTAMEYVGEMNEKDKSELH